jgi:phage shock protein PspC (stress-responsive transcriptional regulator)
MNTTTADARSATFTGHTPAVQLRRSGDDRMLAGVAGGLARYLGADVMLVRVIIATLILFTGAGAALYLAAWLLIPADGQDESIAAAWLARRQDRSRQTPQPQPARPPADPEPPVTNRRLAAPSK